MNLQSLINQGFIQVQKHPNAPLFIYNYTQKTQFERAWNKMTLAARGLIMDAQMNVVARPFPKFFNLGELENHQIPGGDFEVFEKMDGSLGILYWHKNVPQIATRGSFTSEQAQKATQLLHTKYAKTINKLNPDFTYLFEIIYPENRIVVNYGAEEKLVLLAVIETSTHREMEIPEIGFPVVKKYHGLRDLHELRGLEAPNREGFVVRFANGFRLKVKFAEYERLHKVMTRLSVLRIWEGLAAGTPVSQALDNIPDEFFAWIRETESGFRQKFNRVEAKLEADFKVLDSRKATALYFQTCDHPGLLFAKLDQKPVAQKIWKMLRPSGDAPVINTLKSFKKPIK